MRTALVRDGKVVDVIIAGPDYRPQFGIQAIPSETAGIGYAWDGKEFVKSAPKHEELLAHAVARSGDIAHIVVDIPAIDGKPAVKNIALTRHDRTFVAALAARAERNPKFEAPLQQVAKDQPVVTLSGKQYIALNEAVTDWYIDHYRAYAGVVQAIKDGFVTNHDQVDYPPSRVPSWPPRRYDIPELR